MTLHDKIKRIGDIPIWEYLKNDASNKEVP